MAAKIAFGSPPTTWEEGSGRARLARANSAWSSCAMVAGRQSIATAMRVSPVAIALILCLTVSPALAQKLGHILGRFRAFIHIVTRPATRARAARVRRMDVVARKWSCTHVYVYETYGCTHDL